MTNPENTASANSPISSRSGVGDKLTSDVTKNEARLMILAPVSTALIV
jgi:hypothetical protein